MDEIPAPQTLDPDRLLHKRGAQFTEDDRPEAELLDKALHETCDYAQQLWDNLNAMRCYLLDSLPPDPRAPGPHITVAASPTGPDDEEGWGHWMDAFASISSVLCGPHGDSGLGLSRARQEVQRRRSAVELTTRAEQDQVPGTNRPATAPEPSGPAATTCPGAGATATPTAASSVSSARAAGWTPAKATAVIAFAALVGRGLRRRGPEA